jgi:hypothetical protein
VHESGGQEGFSSIEGKGASRPAGLGIAPLSAIEEGKRRRQVAFAGGGKTTVVTAAGGLSQVAGVRGELLGAGKVGLCQAEASGVHVQQATIGQCASLPETVPEVAKGVDHRFVATEGLVIATEHGQDADSVRGDDDRHLLTRSSPVEGVQGSSGVPRKGQG